MSISERNGCWFYQPSFSGSHLEMTSECKWLDHIASWLQVHWGLIHLLFFSGTQIKGANIIWDPAKLALSNIVSKNIKLPIRFKYQINNKLLLLLLSSKYILCNIWDIIIPKIYFQFIWFRFQCMSYFFSGNSLLDSWIKKKINDVTSWRLLNLLPRSGIWHFYSSYID